MILSKNNNMSAETSLDNSNSLLYKEKSQNNMLNKFVKFKKIEHENYSLPEKKDINLKDPRFKKKGLPKKEKYNNNINEK